MLRTARRVAATTLCLVAFSALAGCGAERAAPVATRPPVPVTTTSGPEDTAPERAERSRWPRARPEVSSSTSREPATTTTIASADAWVAFDQALSSRLIGSGDFAAAVAVAVHGEIVHTAAYGFRVPPPAPPPPDPAASSVPADVTTVAPTSTTPPLVPPEPIEPGDRFRIASISKVITAIVVLQFVEGGQLGLDDPVAARLAEQVDATIGDPAVAGITVRQLLSHTSGLPAYRNTFFGGQVDSCASAARRGLSGGVAGPPGTRYVYSNLNYCLLGLLVEQIAGRPYEDVVTDRLLQPLGIQGMRLATTFDSDPSVVIHPSLPYRNYMEVLGAAGSWVATPSDIVTIINSLDPTNKGWHPLSPALVELMRQPLPATAYPTPGRWYGLGLMAFDDGSFGHTGTVENTHAMVLDRPDGVTWSVLVSGEYPWDTGDLRSIFDRAIDDAGIRFG